MLPHALHPRAQVVGTGHAAEVLHLRLVEAEAKQHRHEPQARRIEPHLCAHIRDARPRLLGGAARGGRGDALRGQGVEVRVWQSAEMPVEVLVEVHRGILPPILHRHLRQVAH